MTAGGALSIIGVAAGRGVRFLREGFADRTMFALLFAAVTGHVCTLGVGSVGPALRIRKLSALRLLLEGDPRSVLIWPWKFSPWPSQNTRAVCSFILDRARVMSGAKAANGVWMTEPAGIDSAGAT